VFDACAGLEDRVEIHLRAHGTAPQLRAILGMAEKNGLQRALKLHPLIHHDQLIASLGEYDVGLALERPENANYSRTVTNKLFSYLLAGLAIVGTDIPGQREVISQIPAAGELYSATNSCALRQILEHWLDHPERLLGAKQAAWDAARRRFCWDVESLRFLDLIGESMISTAAACV
jgi:hypothetical protein